MALESTLAASLSYAPSLRYGDIVKTNPGYDAVRMAEHEALFEGGKLFEDLLKNDDGKFLIKRETEKGAGGGGGPMDTRYENPGPAAAANQATSVGGNTYALRKKYVSYKPRVAGLINFIKAGVLSSAPVIVATKKADQAPENFINKFLNFFGVAKNPTDDPRVAYYHNLNTNADGCNRSLLACKSKLMRDLCVHGRAFGGISFPQTGATDANAASEAGGYDGRFTYISPLEIDDWECDAKGACMLRRHQVALSRSAPTSQQDIKTESWSFITAKGIFTYSIKWVFKDGSFTAPNAADPVELTSVVEIKTGEMPVRMIDVGIHVMELLRPSAIDQINLNADLRWTIAANVYALVIFFTKKGLTGIDPNVMALNLDPEDKAMILSPGPGIVAPLFQALDRNDDESYETMMALILKSAAQASNGRQSTEAKRMDYNTFETLLMIFSEPLRALLQWQLDSIRTKRGDDDIIVTVQGLDNFDIESVAQILNNTAAFLNLPETESIPTARQAMILRAFRAVMGSAATPEQLEQVVKEISAAKPSSDEDDATFGLEDHLKRLKSGQGNP